MCRKSFIAVNAYNIKRRSQINNLSFQPEKQEKDGQNVAQSKQRERIIKFRTKVNRIDNRKTGCLKRFLKISKPLARLVRKGSNY